MNFLRGLRHLKSDTKINIRKAEKGTTSAFMDLDDKKNEGQIRLDNMENYRPLEEPMVEDTSRKVQHLITRYFTMNTTLTKRLKEGFVKHQTRLEFPYFILLRKSTNPLQSGDL